MGTYHFPPFANANGPPFLSRTGNVLRSFLSYNFWFFAFYRKTFLLQMREANLPASYLLPPTCLFCTTLLPLRSMNNKKMQRMLHFLLFIFILFYYRRSVIGHAQKFSCVSTSVPHTEWNSSEQCYNVLHHDRSPAFLNSCWFFDLWTHYKVWKVIWQ